jgi:hypothetical protein
VQADAYYLHIPFLV